MYGRKLIACDAGFRLTIARCNDEAIPSLQVMKMDDNLDRHYSQRRLILLALLTSMDKQLNENSFGLCWWQEKSKIQNSFKIIVCSQL